MRTQEAREYPKRKVIEAFSAQDEVYQIYLFGKEIIGKCDRCSDIDIALAEPTLCDRLE